MNLEVSIVVPDRVFWKESVKEIILPTLNGQMGILKNHIPILTGLDVGVLFIRTLFSNEWTTFVVMGGFALVNNNKVTILVNQAELGSDIDPVEAEQNFLSSKASLDLVNNNNKKLESESQFKRARARYQLSSQKKNL